MQLIGRSVLILNLESRTLIKYHFHVFYELLWERFEEPERLKGESDYFYLVVYEPNRHSKTLVFCHRCYNFPQLSVLQFPAYVRHSKTLVFVCATFKNTSISSVRQMRHSQFGANSCKRDNSNILVDVILFHSIRKATNYLCHSSSHRKVVKWIIDQQINFLWLKHHKYDCYWE